MDPRAWAADARERLLPAAALLLALAVLAGLPLGLSLWGRASPAEAHAAVAAMPAALRGVHAWASSLGLVALLLALLQAWVRGDAAALAPRAWALRMAAVVLVLAAILTGGILAWDHQGWESWRHLAAGLGLAPGAPGSVPLAVLLALHALALPLALAAVLGAAGARPSPGAVRAALPLLAAAIALGVLVPPLHGPAPIEGLVLAKPDWPFLWLVPLQGALGVAALPLGAAIGLGALGALPWLGRAWSQDRRAAFALAGVALGVLLSAIGALA